ncbi:MAG: hypothetical protein J6K89_05895 [Oscillospiraceae bacterium]|nr:hypothetical protein [Oscillospiraceae bacterium]
MENKETFRYTYSAKDQAEIKAIRSKYTAPERTEDKMEQLRRMDGAVTRKASTVALVLGVLGALILGTGMSLVMTDLGEIFGLYGAVTMLVGILIGIPGIVLICMAYPIYNRALRKGREKIAPEIIRLTDELLK